MIPWLISLPDVEVHREKNGKYVVEVHGFDYYNTRTGQVQSGGAEKIAVWALDTDYDGRSLYTRQVFFPMADDKEGWAKLSRSLKSEIDEELIEAYRGTVSLTFEAGANKRIALLGGRKVDLRTPGDLSRYFRRQVMEEAEVQYVA